MILRTTKSQSELPFRRMQTNTEPGVAELEKSLAASTKVVKQNIAIVDCVNRTKTCTFFVNMKTLVRIELAHFLMMYKIINNFFQFFAKSASKYVASFFFFFFHFFDTHVA